MVHRNGFFEFVKIFLSRLSQNPCLKYIEKSISYYLNSLLVSGHKDTADFYINKFKKDFPKLRFSNDYVSEYVIKKNNNKKLSTINNKRYSVQIGSF